MATLAKRGGGAWGILGVATLGGCAGMLSALAYREWRQIDWLYQKMSETAKWVAVGFGVGILDALADRPWRQNDHTIEKVILDELDWVTRTRIVQRVNLVHREFPRSILHLDPNLATVLFFRRSTPRSRYMEWNPDQGGHEPDFKIKIPNNRPWEHDELWYSQNRDFLKSKYSVLSGRCLYMHGYGTYRIRSIVLGPKIGLLIEDVNKRGYWLPVYGNHWRYCSVDLRLIQMIEVRYNPTDLHAIFLQTSVNYMPRELCQLICDFSTYLIPQTSDLATFVDAWFQHLLFTYT